MILNKKNEKVTPKEKAKEIVREVINTFRFPESSSYTVKDREKIMIQLNKLFDRIYKLATPIEKKKENV